MLFALGTIIFLTKEFVVLYFFWFLFMLTGRSDYIAVGYIVAYFLPTVLVIAGVVVFYFGRKQKNNHAPSNITSKSS